jgi:tRNA A-37 threonylcarbamoyl transferase component Bud32
MSPAPADELSIAEQVDARCDQFEAEFAAGRRPRLEDCLVDATEPFRIQLFRGLLELELELRRRAGELPQRDEYVCRFAEYTSVIDLVFAELSAGPSRRFAARASSINASAAETSRGPAQATTASAHPKEIARFQVLQLLGEGAFGAVYKARDPQLDRDVAIKVPRAGTLSSFDRERFLREARAAAGLHHANICPVHEVGTTPDGRDYIVMAFIDGKPLSKVLQSGTKPSDRQVALVIRKLAQALDEAHHKGVIHRDLKPANIMINRKGEPVIMDFGLARRSSPDDAQLSHSGQIMGTPAYMSPEQARGDTKTIGPATDIYSLGVILFEMLCGQRPFTGTVTEVIGQILHVDALPPSHYREHVDPKLQSICMKAIAKQPAERHASMRDFAAALTEFIKGGNPGSAATPAPEPTPLSEFAHLAEMVAAELGAKPAARVLSRGASKQERSKRPNVPWWQDRRIQIAGGLVTVLLLGVVVITIMNKDGTKTTVTAGGDAKSIDVTQDGKPLVKVETSDANNADISNRIVNAPAAVGPRRVELRELNTSAYNTNPWISPDALTIYWEAPQPDAVANPPPWIWTAKRPNPQAAFTDRQALFPGRAPTVSADQHVIVFGKGLAGGGSTFSSAKRDSLTDPFVLSGPIPELAGVQNPKNPALSEDGLTLVFQQGLPSESYLMYCTRTDRQSPWGPAQRVPIGSDPNRQEPMSWPFLSDDGLTIWYSQGTALSPEIWTATRRDRQTIFENHQRVIVEGTPLVGRAPRFVAATGELFYSAIKTEQPPDWSLWVVKDYRPPRGTKSRVADRDQKAAEWVLSIGGRVKVAVGETVSNWIANIAPLPDAPYRLHSVMTADNGQPWQESELRVLTGLTGVNSINFEQPFPYSDATMEVIETLTGLETLRFEDPNEITDAGLARLASLKNLRALNVVSPRMSDASLEVIAKLPNLERLSLGITGYGSEAGQTASRVTARGLSALKAAEKLNHVNVQGVPINDAALQSLGELRQVQSLNVSSPGVVDASLRHLSGMTQLNALFLRNTGVTDAGLVHLKNLANLNDLYLEGSPVTGRGAEHLRGLNNLRRLTLWACPVEDAGLEQLKSLTQLTLLDVRQSKVTDAGIPHLEALAERLEVLHLIETAITDAAIPHLSKLAKLRGLTLNGTQLTADGVTQLRKALPACDVAY